VRSEIPALISSVRAGLFADVESDPNYYGNREIADAS
jgi:hypothetical protein